MDQEVNLNVPNASYWCVARDDASIANNLIFSANNFVILADPQSNDVRYHVEPIIDDRQYIQLDKTTEIQEITIELPEKQSKSDESFWEKNKIKLLLTLCLENKFRDTNQSSNDKNPWVEIASIIGASPEDCIKKFRNLRRTYIRLLKKKAHGRDVKWPYYNICEEVFQEYKLPSLEIWEDHKISKLLNLYIQNLSKFRNPNYLKKTIWQEIAHQLETTEYNCYHKFKNLKRTYFSLIERNRKTGKLIRWPYYEYFETIFHDFNPLLGPWDRNTTKILLGAYKQIEHKFRNPKYQKKELWREISQIVGESPANCDRKFRNLKQTYIKLRAKEDSGMGKIKWRYYKDFEEIYNSGLQYSEDTNQVRNNAFSKDQEDNYVKELLFFYIENLDKFRNPLLKKKNIWKHISSKLGMTPEECDRKFRNLKQTYIRLTDKIRSSNITETKWPYYDLFEEIFGEPLRVQKPKIQKTFDNHPQVYIDDVTISEIGRIVEDVQERKENDKKFDKLIKAVEESNHIQRERNTILQQLLDRH